LNQSTVGSDISSATQGSSITSVAGKNLGPTKQWAEACEIGSNAGISTNANAHKRLERLDMKGLHSA
jgi:hypothetical protein